MWHQLLEQRLKLLYQWNRINFNRNYLLFQEVFESSSLPILCKSALGCQYRDSVHGKRKKGLHDQDNSNRGFGVPSVVTVRHGEPNSREHCAFCVLGMSGVVASSISPESSQPRTIAAWEIHVSWLNISTRTLIEPLQFSFRRSQFFHQNSGLITLTNIDCKLPATLISPDKLRTYLCKARNCMLFLRDR